MILFLDKKELTSFLEKPPFNKQRIEILEKRLYEYLLVLSPRGFIMDRLITEKKYFTGLIGNRDASDSLPHITLANFILSNLKHANIIFLLKSLAANSNCIKVVLENYKWFPHHTIYFDVKYKVDIKQLVRKITQTIRRHIKDDKNGYPPHFILNPHLTLCKRMSPEEYEKSKIEYADLTFSDQFTANYMLLLRRPIDGSEKYKEVGRFEFGGPESCDKTFQLKLFE